MTDPNVDIAFWAKKFTEFGYKVYPVDIALSPTGTKVLNFLPPGWKSGPYPTDPDEIEQRQGSYTGLAVYTGASGVVVVDTDIKEHKGINGEAALRDAGIVLPETPFKVRTQSGGWHRYYRAGSVALGPSEGLLAPGVDIRAGESIAIAPPTRVAGSGTYTVEGKIYKVADLPVFPEHLARKLVSKPKLTVVSTAEQRQPTEDEARFHEQRRTEALARIEAAADGQRHTALLQNAPVVFGVAALLGEDPALAMPDIEAAYDKSGGIDWENEERTALSALRYATDNPYVLPPLDDDVPAHLTSEEERQEYRTQLKKLRAVQAARDEIKREQQAREAGSMVLATGVDGDFLDQPAPEQRWLVEGLIHREVIRCYVIGQYKAGKSTLATNLIASLTSGKPFLNKFTVHETLKVAYFDLEQGQSRIQEMMAPLPGLDRRKLRYYDLNGQGRQLDLRIDGLRQAWARELMAHGVEILVVDPLSSVIAGTQVDENSSQVRELLDAFDALAREAGLRGVIMVDHAGHGDESKQRGRGSSSKMDWITTRLAVTRASESTDSQRTFFADGRGVRPFRGVLELNAATNEMTLDSSSEADPDATWLASQRHTTLTLAFVQEQLRVSESTARRKLSAAGWSSSGNAGQGRGNLATWQWVDPNPSAAYDPWA